MALMLVGYRGTGKSTVARCLAAELHWHWLDADIVLEQRQGKTIAEIFASQGEAAFRDYESHILQELVRMKDHVIATGGGVVLRESNRQALAKAGHVVWLTARPATIDQRISADVTSASRRPALTSADSREEIKQLLAVRTPLYRSVADFTVATDERTPAQITAEILAWLRVDD